MPHFHQQLGLEERVVRAAEAALARQQYVRAIDVFCGMGLLLPSQVNDWRKGQIDFLERVIQGNLSKISSSMAIFRRWANEKSLKPSETDYVRGTRSGTLPLRFSKSGDLAIEKNYRTHYVSPTLSKLKQQKLEEKLGEPPKPVVFEVVRDSQCSECGVEIAVGSFLLMAGERDPASAFTAQVRELANRMGWKLWDEALTEEIARAAQVDRTAVAPQPHEIAAAVAKRLGDGNPYLFIDLKAPPTGPAKPPCRAAGRSRIARPRR